jgi:3-dehydrosphinganine reductase
MLFLQVCVRPWGRGSVRPPDPSPLGSAQAALSMRHHVIPTMRSQHVLITGGSSGIGRALARLTAQKGACISVIARDPEKLERARREIQDSFARSDQKVIAFSADVSDRIQIETAVTAAIGELGPPDLVVTSAGMAHPGRFMDLSISVFERTMAVNYFGTLYTVRAALPSMLARKRGHLVLISSGAGLIGIYGYTPYCPGKFAVRGLAESLRGELKQGGISVSVVYPPDTDTPQHREEDKTKPPETRRITAMARTWSAEGVARVILEGVRRKSFLITPGMEMRLLSSFHSILRPFIQRYLDYLTSRSQAGSSQPP